MNHSIGEAGSLLNMVADESDLERRIERISGYFIGRPYIGNPLGGGPAATEVFTARLDGFDCVTYIETVLALALSRSANEFIDTLLSIRYKGGEVSWPCRNHYMVDWARNNRSAGFIEDLTRGEHAVRIDRVLSVVPGLPEYSVSFSCFPKRKIGRVRQRIRTGDLMLFASTKKNLDVFHAGLLVVKDYELMLRHATRSVGAVVEQPLSTFLSSNRMSGVMLLRPLAAAGALCAAG